MQTRRVGSSGLTVSRLGLGTMTWGQGTDEHVAREQLLAFVGAGGSLVDTAYSYAGGHTEEILGGLIGTAVARRELVLATKAGINRDSGERVISTSRRALLDGLDTSLRRLGVDHVDLWQVHVWSETAPLEETLAALDDAVRSGRTRYVGVSNYKGWQLAQAATHQILTRQAPLVSHQVEYSLLNRWIEGEGVEASQAHGVGLLPWSPLGRGVLTGKYRLGLPADSRAGTEDFARFVNAYLTDDHARVVEAVCRAADGLGWTPAQVALAWVRDAPGVAAPIVGARTTPQLVEALASETLELPVELVAALNDVSEGL